MAAKTWGHRIVMDPAILFGKPHIAGTRIAVDLILEKLAAGESLEQILAAHPRLTPEDIRAALAFAAECVRSLEVYPVEAETRETPGG
ncbi:hypothetical protein HRbin11_00973 [bacterium HR11]|nr:hypothetical protein HRbin11_00973 [bacterium HR11]